MNSSVAKPVPDFSPRSDYLFPGQTPRDPVFLDIDRIADDAMRRVQAAVEETTAEAGAKAVAAMEEIQAVVEKTSKDADAKAQEALRIAQEAMDKAARVRAAPGEEHELKKASAEPAPEAKKAAPERTSWLAWLKKFLANLIRRVVGAVGQAFGANVSTAGQAGDEGGESQGDGGPKEAGTLLGGTTDNPAVAELVLDEIEKVVEDLCKDRALMDGLIAAKSSGPEAMSGVLRQILSRLEGECGRVEKALQLQHQAYQEVLEKHATRDMSALKMDSYLQKGQMVQARVPPAVVEEFEKLRAVKLSHEKLDGLIAGVMEEAKVGISEEMVNLADGIAKSHPGILAALGREQERAAKAAASFMETAPAVQPSGAGPVTPAVAAAPKLQAAMSTRPKFGSGKQRMAEEGPSSAELGILDLGDEPLERPRG